MKIETIKPIPKAIENKIRALDQKWYEQAFNVRFFSYLVIQKGELVKITVAVRNHKKSWYCKQVAVHGLHSEECYVKDMEYNYYGMGFRVGWYKEGLQGYRRSYETGEWDTANAQYYDPFAPVVNLNVIDKLPAFKYSSYKLFQGKDILSYLRLYEKYPQEEYLLKLGLGQYWDSKTILRRVATDKPFCKWLIRNRQELSVNYYYISAILRSYKTGEPLAVAQRTESRLKTFRRDHDNRRIYKLFRGKLLERFFDYIDEKQISVSLYKDYLTACQYLGLDMTLNKNRFPHDFMRWHDERIDEYRTKKYADDVRRKKEEAEKMAREQAELFRKFAAVADKYIALTDRTNDKEYLVMIAHSPDDLINEGDYLHHCVGGMGYKYKFAEERSLIFFVRKLSAPDVPFVTMEYSIPKHCVLQCYGDRDSLPDDSVLHYVNDIWLPYANAQIKKIEKAA